MNSHKLLFLDIDGVLNSLRTCVAVKEGIRDYMDPVAVLMIKELCSQTKATIVVSSTWRRHVGLAGIRECLKKAGWDNVPELEYQTPVTSDGFRGEEVALFLDEFEEKVGPVKSYVIFDDDKDFYLPDWEKGHHRAKIGYYYEQNKPRKFRENQPLVQTVDAYGLCASQVKIARYILNTLPEQPSGDKKLLKLISDLRRLEKFENSPYQPLDIPVSTINR